MAVSYRMLGFLTRKEFSAGEGSGLRPPIDKFREKILLKNEHQAAHPKGLLIPGG